MLLPPYTSELLYDGIKVEKVSIENDNANVKELNLIRTTLKKDTIDIGMGLNLLGSENLEISFQHLCHDEFTYNIHVSNTNKDNVIGSVRIFMCPTTDENTDPLSFYFQKKCMIELDKFSVKCEYNKLCIIYLNYFC
jgi:tyrosinase